MILLFLSRCAAAFLPVTFAAVAAFALPDGARRACPPPTATDPVTGRNDWVRLFSSIGEAHRAYEELYSGPRRLRDRAFLREGQYVANHSSGEVVLPMAFVERLEAQLAAALDAGYADFIFYPDLGHLHVLASESMRGELAQLPSFGARIFRVLSAEDSQFLFHTAEFFQLRSGSRMDGPVAADPWLAWRYHSRNFVGQNSGPLGFLRVLFARGQTYNTVRELPGFDQLTTMYVSANKAGCLTARSRSQGDVFFDVTFY